MKQTGCDRQNTECTKYHDKSISLYTRTARRCTCQSNRIHTADRSTNTYRTASHAPTYLRYVGAACAAASLKRLAALTHMCS